MTTELKIGDVVRIRRSAKSGFAGCTGQVAGVRDGQIGVVIMAPNMTEFAVPLWFHRSEISASREEGDD